jgi:hypothetical protein
VGVEGAAGAELVAERRAGDGEEAGLGVGGRHRGERAGRADDGHPQRLAAECDAAVVGDDGDHVAPRVRAAPQDDAVGVDAGQSAGEGDRGVVVLAVAAPVDELPGLAGRSAEGAVVEDDGIETGGGEALGEGPQPAVARAAEAMGHDHAGAEPRPLRRNARRRGARRRKEN